MVVQWPDREPVHKFVAREILKAADPHRPFNEVQLFRFAEQDCEEDTVFSSNVSYEVYRLDSTGFTELLLVE